MASYKLPDKCCRCLGPAETRKAVWLTSSFIEGSMEYFTHYSFEVPLCNRCATYISWVKAGLLVVSNLVMLIGIGLVILKCTNADTSFSLLPLLVVLLFLFLVTIFYYLSLDQVKLVGEHPEFNNSEYQRLFLALNDIQIRHSKVK